MSWALVLFVNCAYYAEFSPGRRSTHTAADLHVTVAFPTSKNSHTLPTALDCA